MPLPTVRNLRRVRDDLVAQRVGQLRIGLEAHAHRRRRAVVGVALQLVDQIVARVVRLGVAAVLLVDQPDVVVAVDQRGHDGLARQVHDRGIRRRPPLALAADPREGVALDEEGGVLDRRASCRRR